MDDKERERLLGILYCDREGNSITNVEWMKLFSDRDYQSVKVTTLSDGRKISTVWLGLNHNGNYFETALIDDDGIDVLFRYQTEKMALLGHRNYVEELMVESDATIVEEDSKILEFQDELEKIRSDDE